MHKTHCILNSRIVAMNFDTWMQMYQKRADYIESDPNPQYREWNAGKTSLNNYFINHIFKTIKTVCLPVISDLGPVPLSATDRS